MKGFRFDVKGWLLRAVAAFLGLFLVGFFIEVVYLVIKGEPFMQAWQRYLADSLTSARLTSRAIIALAIGFYFMYRRPPQVRRQID